MKTECKICDLVIEQKLKELQVEIDRNLEIISDLIKIANEALKSGEKITIGEAVKFKLITEKIKTKSEDDLKEYKRLIAELGNCGVNLAERQ